MKGLLCMPWFVFAAASAQSPQVEHVASSTPAMTQDQQDAAQLLAEAMRLEKRAQTLSSYELSIGFMQQADRIATAARRMRLESAARQHGKVDRSQS